MAAHADPGDPGEPTRRGGRVRSRQAEEAVLDSAAELLEELGYAGVTIEGVAARAGVAKSTIYRWWKSKAELVMDAYGHSVARRMPEPDTGSVAEDLSRFATELYRVVEYPMRVKALRGMMAEAQLDADFAEPFRVWVQGRRAVVAGMLRRGIERGELPAGLDVEYGVDLLFGPFWYRLLVGHQPLRPENAPAHTARMLSGLRADVG